MSTLIVKSNGIKPTASSATCCPSTGGGVPLQQSWGTLHEGERRKERQGSKDVKEIHDVKGVEWEKEEETSDKSKRSSLSNKGEDLSDPAR
jgi:hypothetical protein